MAIKVGGPYPATWHDAVKDRHRVLADLRRGGIDPFRITRYDRTHSIRGLRAACPINQEDVVLPINVRIAGRLVSVRVMGRALFAHLEDQSGQVQIYINANQNPAALQFFRSSIGNWDILGVAGDMFYTRTGELTLKVKELSLLAKTLRPLYERNPAGQVDLDPELAQRQRYVDLACNPHVRDRFRVRGDIVRYMRQFLWELDFMEVETPILQEIYGGASARPFVTRSNALGMDLTMRIATELHLKRLIAGGYERVFEIGRIFRNEGIDRKHNPEFTSMELYWAYVDYEKMMWITETMVAHIVKKIFGRHQLTYQGQELNFTPPWRRVTMEEAIGQIGGVEVLGTAEARLRGIAQERKIELDDRQGRGWIISALFEGLVEGELVQPTFITRYPVETTPLAKRCPDNPDFVERFEAYVAGMELANAFSELNDPLDQRARFEEQVAQKAAGDEEAQPFDEDYVQALEIGMPPTGGLGIGIDRLAMLLTDSASIRDVVLFPTMKPRREG